MMKTICGCRKWAVALLFGGFFVGVVGCGGGDEPSSAPTETEFKQAQEKQADIHMREYGAGAAK